MSYKTPLASTTNFGLVKVGTGITVVNGIISSAAVPANYGFFTSTTTQTNPVANAVNFATFNNTGPANSISITGGNAITVVNAGTYTKLFTLNVNKTSECTSPVSIWLRVNGIDVVGSAQSLELINTLSTIFVSGNFTLNIPAGGNIQLCWSSPDTTVSLLAIPIGVLPIRPTGTSTKVTLTRIA